MEELWWQVLEKKYADFVELYARFMWEAEDGDEEEEVERESTATGAGVSDGSLDQNG